MRSVYHVLFALTLLAGGAAAWIRPGIGADSPVPASTAPDVLRRQTIAFYERRLREDPQSALDMAQLAALFMEEGRMRADDRPFVQAESLARRSLGERTRRNGRSAALLVNALLAQHRFVEATDIAGQLVRSEPETPAYRALLAETLMEVGEYRRAIGLLGSVRPQRAELGIAPRFARWAELTGQPGEARRILRAARDEAMERADLTGEQRAWFSLRLADLELRYGHLRGASAAIEDGLRASPGDWRLILARGRLEAARGSWRKALRSGEDVIATVPSPDGFALLASAHKALGRNDEASAFELALDGITRRQPRMIHRTWALALLDQGRNPTEILSLAAADTLVRQDVHSLDLLAWALHRAGRSAEAVTLARRAVALGTIEPALRLHAGMIEFADGDPAVARQHLLLALRGRGALSRQQVTTAKAALATLAGRN